MYLLYVFVVCICCMYLLYVFVVCICCMYLFYVFVVCICCMYLLLDCLRWEVIDILVLVEYCVGYFFYRFVKSESKHVKIHVLANLNAKRT